MTSFSQRYGYKPTKKVLQLKDVDAALRISLWNALDYFYWSTAKTNFYLRSEPNHDLFSLLRYVWTEFLVLPIDSLGTTWEAVHQRLSTYYFACGWNEVYDFVEFVANHYIKDGINDEFRNECNRILVRECSGYRFVGNKVSLITSEQEIAEIEEALQQSGGLTAVTTHLQSALHLFSDRKSPNYRNSIKESISAVEAISKLVTGKEKATLGEALKSIADVTEMHPTLHKAFSILYGYTSQADGIRHALLEEDKLDSEDAKFMLVACSAFVNYLKVKASKAGIKL